VLAKFFILLLLSLSTCQIDALISYWHEFITQYLLFSLSALVHLVEINHSENALSPIQLFTPKTYAYLPYHYIEYNFTGKYDNILREIIQVIRTDQSFFRPKIKILPSSPFVPIQQPFHKCSFIKKGFQNVVQKI